MNRRRLLGLLTATMLLLPSAALAADATATALHVDGVVTVSSSEGGQATGLSVLGQDVTGTSGDGSTHVASTKDLGVPEEVVEVTVLQTEVDGESSSADAVVVEVGGDDGVRVTALSSSRDGSSAETSGVAVSSGGRTLTVGSTTVDTDGGSTAVLDADGNRVLTDEDTDGRFCGAEVPQVLRAEALCVESNGDEHEAELLRDVDAAPGGTDLGLPSLHVLRANGVGDPVTPAGPPPPPPGPAPAPEDPTSPDSPRRPSTPVTTAGTPEDGPLAAPTPAPEMPVAGAPALVMLAAALGSIGAGAGLLRRRPSA